ncbi:hypothetical protein BC829DRAFT_403536 [Chytridium lagenaria]|nr:hypothetical protein BC829DRAFT_403536 [Chytridium lagenaria]
MKKSIGKARPTSSKASSSPVRSIPSSSDRDRIPILAPESKSAIIHKKALGRGESPTRGASRYDLFEQQRPTGKERPKTAPSQTHYKGSSTVATGRNVTSRYSQGSYTLSQSQRSSTSYKEETRQDDSQGLSHDKKMEVERRKDIVIHVFDENRNAKRDFYCKRHLLLKEMKYFSTYLNERTHGNQVEIDVHCDIEVFDWLMCFITKQKPILEPRISVSILISSNFLQMHSLETFCLNYVHDNINDVVKVPIDMSCISKSLLSKLAKLFSVNKLATIIDPKDKMLSKLYMFKLDELLTTPVPVGPNDAVTVGPSSKNAKMVPITLRRCSYCQAIYPKHLERYLTCPNGQPLLDFYGDLFMIHEKDIKFDFNEYIGSLVAGGMPWRKVFWRIWALITHMYCSTCESMVSLFDYNACLRHPLDIVFPPGECQKGRYPCCDSTELRFNPFVLSKGCQKAKHDFDCSSETFQMFLANMDDILEPTDTNQTEPPKLNDRDGLIKIFGKWSEGIYRRMESSNIAISMMSGRLELDPIR